ncbi:CHAT domain-containing protein [Nocardioides zeicaulis]|uniref:CHAT domain-containing protein n=1 Tax=Nocardioides zeicaulis TaxID=1776857 RepID=A0ABV6DXI5_9ACTN
MDRAEAEELLRTLFADPVAARETAEARMLDHPDPAVRSIGHQVVGIVLRDVGETQAALAHLRRALRLARGVDAEREADVRATLGGSLAMAGRTRDGLEQLDLAASAMDGLPLARVLVRRARVLAFNLERLEAGAADLERALEILEPSDDLVWTGRALHLHSWASTMIGDLAAARTSLARSLAVHEELGMEGAVAAGIHNQGWLAFLGGDLPLAFERYQEAATRYERLGITSTDLVYDRCVAFMAAGLASDALEVVELALGARRLLPVERADLQLALAGAALAAGDVPRAQAAADEACRMFRAQARHRHWVRAELFALWARAEDGVRPARLLGRAERLVATAREAGAPELPAALMLGVRIARAVRSERAERHVASWLGEAASFRASGPGTSRATGWLARAWQHERAGNAAAVLRACERGLTALDEHRAALGSQELRALSSRDGAELAGLGLRTALATREPRRVLRWAERWRATALTAPALQQAHDTGTAADLAALRAQHQRLAQAQADGAPTDRIRARAARLERSVRQRLLHLRGAGGGVDAFAVERLVEAQREDGATFVELTEVDGVLHALVVRHGRVRLVTVGDASAAARAVDFALFSLRQAARGRRAQLGVAGARLEQALLGTSLRHVDDQRVVVSATASLQGVPWGLLPSLVDRHVTTTPSARLWLRARAAQPTSERRVLLVGPGLGSGGAEVHAVAAEDRGAEVLEGSAATVPTALATLDGAALAHVAAHGSFREDSPLFSSLTLADGPLLVHDLQQLRHPPHRVVLSACESGVLAPVGDQELLGLSAALLSMGTAGVVSALAEVDDSATVEVMVALHAALRRGAGLGEALHAARAAAASDPVLAATAASFTAMGT